MQSDQTDAEFEFSFSLHSCDLLAAKLWNYFIQISAMLMSLPRIESLLINFVREQKFKF